MTSPCRTGGRAHITGRRSSKPCRDANGDIAFVVQRSENVTEAHRLRRQNEIISAELHHRVRNMLAVIQSIARMTGRVAVSAPQFVSEFNERLSAMSRTFEQLSENAGEGLPLRTLLESGLRAFTGPSERYSLEGPHVVLSVRSTKDASMLIHEMVTNAIKYGCLMEPQGRLAVRWAVNADALVVDWTESECRGVKAPSREGFGTKMLSFFPNLIIERDFRPDGLRMRITVPLWALTGPDTRDTFDGLNPDRER